MEQKKQKTRIFDSKLFWIIISLLASLSIWTYVASTENSVVTQIFRGVQVEIVGEDTLRNSKNLIVTDVDTNSVRVEIRGPRRIVDALESDDLIAQIDVSKLSRAAFASMKYKLVYPDGVDTRNLAEVSYSPEGEHNRQPQSAEHVPVPEGCILGNAGIRERPYGYRGYQ